MLRILQAFTLSGAWRPVILNPLLGSTTRYQMGCVVWVLLSVLFATSWVQGYPSYPQLGVVDAFSPAATMSAEIPDVIDSWMSPYLARTSAQGEGFKSPWLTVALLALLASV